MNAANEKDTAQALSKSGTGLKDITNQRFSMLVALYPLDHGTLKTTTKWRCRCDCGNEVDVSYHNLIRGNNKSCGCLKRIYQTSLHDRLHFTDGTCVEWLIGRKHRIDNVSGFRGVYKKKNGRYVVSIGFKKKIYYIGTYDSYDEAVNKRLSWESLVHDGFVRSRALWIEMAERDPDLRLFGIFILLRSFLRNHSTLWHFWLLPE